MRICRTLRCAVKLVQKTIKDDLNVIHNDKYVVHVKAGSGGSGISRYNGRGGDGGSVIFQPVPGIAFADIKKNLGSSMKIKADNGSPSLKTKLVGSHASDVTFSVPIGVEIVDDKSNILIARCKRPFHRYSIARGGIGGNEKNGFKGEKGEQIDVAIHLKLRPNVGLVGFPNAGKSTLLKAFMPRKSVKIAPYPFTTVKPQMGFWAAPETDSSDRFTLSIADLPGLIEGASKNRGKGYKFLKHLEYCDVLLFVVDSTGFQLASSLHEPFRSPLEVVALLNKELESYDPKLVQKPAVLLLNKTDIVQNKEKLEDLTTSLKSSKWWKHLPEDFQPINPIKFDYVLPVSAKSGEIEEVQKALLRIHKDLNPFNDKDISHTDNINKLI